MFVVLPPEASAMLSYAFLALALLVIAAAVSLVHLARLRLGHAPSVVWRGTAVGAAVALGWTAAWLVLAASGRLARFDVLPPPAALLPVAVVGAGVALARSRIGGWLEHGVPTAILIGFQAFRLPLELTMHRAVDEGVMPIQMSFSGWNFDIVTGLLALVVGLTYRTSEPPRWVVVAFSAIGMGLLVNIVGISIASMPLVRAFGDDPSVVNTFVLFPPFVVLPCVLVLAALVGQLVLFRKLRGTAPAPDA